MHHDGRCVYVVHLGVIELPQNLSLPAQSRCRKEWGLEVLQLLVNTLASFSFFLCRYPAFCSVASEMAARTRLVAPPRVAAAPPCLAILWPPCAKAADGRA